MIHRYDINSAYPAEMLTLPSYRGATWKNAQKWDGSDNSMVHVRWAISEDRPFYPLWYREHDGTILYPQSGEGVYWGRELRNLINGTATSDYEIIDATNVRLSDTTKPFQFIEEKYAIRQTFKRDGNMAHEALKLGLNSLYGKLAQQAGGTEARPPTYHQLLWAGQITAGARAKVYEAAMQKPEAIIAFATDAVLSLEPLDLKIGTGLGEWTYDAFDGITIVQPGVYWLEKDGHWSEKYRGFDKGSLMREKIVECWRNGTDFTASLTRFVGIGSALMSTDFQKVWRTWPTDPRTLSLTPAGKRQPGQMTCYADQLCDTIPTVNLNDGVMSKPYPILWIGGRRDVASIDGVDVDELERELLDSYA